jgi:hypothetical protein
LADTRNRGKQAVRKLRGLPSEYLCPETPVEKRAGEVDNGLRACSCDTNCAYRFRSGIRKGSWLREKAKTYAVQGWRRFTIKTYQSAENRSGCS